MMKERATRSTGGVLATGSATGTSRGWLRWSMPKSLVALSRGCLSKVPQLEKSLNQCASLRENVVRPRRTIRTRKEITYTCSACGVIIIPDPRVCGVSLTGSEAAGAAVAEVAGRNLKKVVLELGGSDPFILLSTDNLDEAVDAAVAARLDNSGQACNAAKRFIVIDGLYDDFLARFTAKITGNVPADPMSLDTTLGPLSSLGAAENLEAQLLRAEAQGAKVVARGHRDGAFFTPSVLTGVTPDNDVYRDEFFGPVATVYRVQNEAEALQLANDIPFGLGSYLFTTDAAQALRVADLIEVGMVFVNGAGLDSAELPFGGVKRSGFGRELGRFGIAEFANKKLIRILH